MGHPRRGSKIPGAQLRVFRYSRFAEGREWRIEGGCAGCNLGGRQAAKRTPDFSAAGGMEWV